MIAEKRRMLCIGENIQHVVARRGYLSTQIGLVVRSDEALQLISKLRNVEQSRFQRRRHAWKRLL